LRGRRPREAARFGGAASASVAASGNVPVGLAMDTPGADSRTAGSLAGTGTWGAG